MEVLNEVKKCNHDLHLKVSNLEKQVSKLEYSRKLVKIAPSPKVRVS